MRRLVAASLSIAFILQPICALAQQGDGSGVDTRVFLVDGSVVEGRLIEHSEELVIVEVEERIFTFEMSDVDVVTTLSSLGASAQTKSVVEFPYISFLGATAALSLMSWLQFDTASQRDANAARHEEQGTLPGALDLSARASEELVIVEVEERIFTFEMSDVDVVTTLSSLGASAQTKSVVEFPYISFLGATAALSLMSWLQFDTASHFGCGYWSKRGLALPCVISAL